MARILLIGQEWVPRALIRAQLEHEGHEVANADTLYDGVQVLRAWPGGFDLVVVDSSGQALDSDESSDLIQSGIPVLALTGQLDPSRPTLIGLGFKDAIVRPAFVGDVVAAVSRLLRANGAG